MNFLLQLKKYWKEIIILLEVIIIILLVVCKMPKKYNNQEIEEDNSISYESEAPNEIKEVRVDIKGAINKPGVYTLSSSSIIDDVIKLAGGLKKNADTSNINLSKQIENEMVIRIFTSTEIKNNKTNNIVTCEVKKEDLTSCSNASIITIDKDNSSNKENTNNNKENVNDESINVSPNDKDNNKISLININTASKEDLMTLTGIGEAKANNIIEYRATSPFEKIEDIKNISGIGDQAFEKIKDYITV